MKLQEQLDAIARDALRHLRPAVINIAYENLADSAQIVHLGDIGEPLDKFLPSILLPFEIDESQLLHCGDRAVLEPIYRTFVKDGDCLKNIGFSSQKRVSSDWLDRYFAQHNIASYPCEAIKYLFVPIFSSSKSRFNDLQLTTSGWIQALWVNDSSMQPFQAAEVEYFNSLATFLGNNSTHQVLPTFHHHDNTDKSSLLISDMRARYRRLVANTSTLIIRSSADLVIQEVIGDPSIVECSVSDLLGDHLIIHNKMLAHATIAAKKKIAANLRRSFRTSEPFHLLLDGNFGNRKKWFTVTFIPLAEITVSRLRAATSLPEEPSVNRLKKFLERNSSAWEVIIQDVTEIREGDDIRRAQEEKIEALYRIACAVEHNIDPHVIASRGLEALIDATKAKAGIVAFFDRDLYTFEVISGRGFSNYTLVPDLEKDIINSKKISQVVISRKGFIINDMNSSPELQGELTTIRQEMVSCLVVPLVHEDVFWGILAVFGDKPSQFGEDEVHFATISGSQICNAAKRAEGSVSERQQQHTIKALYNLTHEITKYLSPKEIASRAFSIITEEFTCRRMWLGITNDRGNFIVTQAVKGNFDPKYSKLKIPLDDWRKFSLLQVQGSRETSHAFILSTEKAMNLANGELITLLKQFEGRNLIFLPLISVGELSGLLIIEPIRIDTTNISDKLRLLGRMGNEIANVLVARGFEGKMAWAEKMRMAGVLASGVAHNFNNLLQAIIGQASLLELKVKNDDILESVQEILDASKKGAGLINNLLNFSLRRYESMRIFDIVEFLHANKAYFQHMVGGKTLNFKLSQTPAYILGDQELIKQVITVLLINAKEAVSDLEYERQEILVITDVYEVASLGHYIKVSITDNGRGMSFEEQARCFEPFFTTKDQDLLTGVSANKAGLGLSTAYSVMKHHHGNIHLESEIGRGTTVTMLFPVVMEDGKASVGIELGLIGFDPEVEHELISRFEAYGIKSKVYNVLKGSGMPKTVLIDLDNASIEIKHLLNEEASFIGFAIDAEGTEFTLKSKGLGEVKVYEKPIDVWRIYQLARNLIAERHTTK